jgi:uncharacterized protein (DUF1810 family)
MQHETLDRFLDAQMKTFDTALKEITSGRKQSHWMWYIFPQLKGLGRSETANYYGIENIDEASAYLRHPVLGKRLIVMTTALLQGGNTSATDIFGTPDDMKLKSSMTLFAQVSNAPVIFQQVLDKYFNGQPDSLTLELLQPNKNI